MIHRKGFRMLFPKVQTRFLGFLCLLGLTAVSICSSIATIGLVWLSGRMPSDSTWLMEQMPSTVGVLFVASLAVSLPAVALVGAFASMPLFGALHRIHGFLESVASGEESKDLKLRAKDPLQNLAAIVNEVTSEQRAQNQVQQDSDEPVHKQAA